jgi:hypothetical protein
MTFLNVLIVIYGLPCLLVVLAVLWLMLFKALTGL